MDESPEPALQGCWLGTVVPKRHARRAVTRNLLKRQMRAAMQAHGAQLPPGLWVLRLKQPFDRKSFVSASSEALRIAVRDELAVLFERALRPLPAGFSARSSRPSRPVTP